MIALHNWSAQCQSSLVFTSISSNPPSSPITSPLRSLLGNPHTTTPTPPLPQCTCRSRPHPPLPLILTPHPIKHLLRSLTRQNLPHFLPNLPLHTYLFPFLTQTRNILVDTVHGTQRRPVDYPLAEFVLESCFLAGGVSDIYRGLDYAGFLGALHFLFDSVEGVGRGFEECACW